MMKELNLNENHILYVVYTSTGKSDRYDVGQRKG